MILDPKPWANAWPIIVYSKQYISQLRDQYKTFVEVIWQLPGTKTALTKRSGNVLLTLEESLILTFRNLTFAIKFLSS